MPNTASLTFDGVNDALTGASSQPSSIANLGSFTVEFWCYMQGDATKWGVDGAETMVCLGDWSTAHCQIRHSFGFLSFTWNSGFTYVVDQLDYNMRTLYAANQWAHIAATWDGTTRRLIIDGTDRGNTATHSIAKPASTTSRPMLGNRAAGDGSGTDGWFKGKLDEFRIWNTARSAATIAAYKDTQASGSESGLILCWRMNDGSGTNVDDVSATAYDGTITGAAWDTSIFPTLSDPAGATKARPPQRSPLRVWTRKVYR